MKNFLISFFIGRAAAHADKNKKTDMQKISDHLNKKTKEPWTWVFYGDSITHGACHTRGYRSFVEIFHEYLRWELRFKEDSVINSGSSGYSTFELLNEDYYNFMVRRYKPQVVFLLIGCNDIVLPECGGAEGFRLRLEKLVKRIQQDGSIVVLQTYNTMRNVKEPEDYAERYVQFPAFNQVIRDTAEKYNTILIDHCKYWEEKADLETWLDEPLHPGAPGHLEMAKLILESLNADITKSPACQININR